MSDTTSEDLQLNEKLEALLEIKKTLVEEFIKPNIYKLLIDLTSNGKETNNVVVLTQRTIPKILFNTGKQMRLPKKLENTALSKLY